MSTESPLPATAMLTLYSVSSGCDTLATTYAVGWEGVVMDVLVAGIGPIAGYVPNWPACTTKLNGANTCEPNA